MTTVLACDLCKTTKDVTWRSRVTAYEVDARVYHLNELMSSV